MGHSFVRRAQTDIEDVLSKSEIVEDHEVKGLGGMKFGCDRFKKALEDLTTLLQNCTLPLVSSFS